jgi:hypothetical protein
VLCERPVNLHYRFYEKVIKVKDDVAAILIFFLDVLLSALIGIQNPCSQGMHKGAAALLWGEPAASMRDSAFCWRAACFRRGGNRPAPACPFGETGKGLKVLAAADHFDRCSTRGSAFRKAIAAATPCRASIRTLIEPLWARCMLRSDFKPRSVTNGTNLGCWGAAI